MQAFNFHPAIAEWFERRFGSPTEPQARGWPIIQSGQHALISAPTGSGKTLAAFLASLDQLFRQAATGHLPNETQVVYVSPLKALSNDIHKNLEEPLAGIRRVLAEHGTAAVDVRAEVRTGDTPAQKRQAIVRKPPHILVTTPESLYLLLTSASGQRMLRTVRTLIADEIHAVVSNRRGSHLAISMERLRAMVGRPIQRIGLSATQKPIEEVARFLIGSGGSGTSGETACAIVQSGHMRKLDLAVEIPGSPLEAVMSNEVWEEVYSRLAGLIEQHRTTLVFVNTRRLAERVTHHLAQRLGNDKVTSHHGSLSAKLRLDAENRLKRGELKALVATASLELGIDIGSVDLVCQLGSTRSISTLLQRVGRAEHTRAGLPKGRLFPLTRDELVECSATIRSVRRGELDLLQIPEKPLDILAQQIVACAASQDWDEEELFGLMRRAYPYRILSRDEFDAVIKMLAEGFSTRRGRRGALIHHDGVNRRIRARRGARLLALTSGGAIPDNADYRVVIDSTETLIGTVNEDFAVESMAGEIFQLGNASWNIRRINSGTVRVEDAHGQPPSIPFWLGEAPSRTAELSAAVSELRSDIERRLRNGDDVARWLAEETGLSPHASIQVAEYFEAGHRVLGVIPSQKTLVIERFFDESGGMQLVIHSLFGSRINRAWGLALRKRFCRKFNFELQAAATDDAIVLSLGTQHSFPLAEVFHYLHSNTVRELLVQALLDAPMFAIRWRWNAARALAVPRQRGNRRTPPPIQRMEAEDLIAAVFPDQLACLENIVGDREIPDHPLVNQTIHDCLTEAMDIDGLIRLLRQIEVGTVVCVARDLPETSPLAHEILNAKPYAFLDNAPLEERRTQAVYKRRALESAPDEMLSRLDQGAIEQVCAEAWPRPQNADEMHDALMQLGVLADHEACQFQRGAEKSVLGSTGCQPVPSGLSAEQAGDSPDGTGAASEANPDAGFPAGAAPLPVGESPACSADRPTGAGGSPAPPIFQTRLQAGDASWDAFLHSLAEAKRAVRLVVNSPHAFWVATERLSLVQAVFPDASLVSSIPPPFREVRAWGRSEALRELLRGRVEVMGPVTAGGLSRILGIPRSEIDAALIALEAEGFVLRGRFREGAPEQEWCERRLLARIHRLTINRLRAEIQPVSIHEFCRFLAAWQRVDEEHRAEGPEGVAAVLEILDGYELAAGAWEPDVLSARVRDYDPQWLDRACFTGRIGWGRLSVPPPQTGRGFSFGPMRSSPITLFQRENLAHWIELGDQPGGMELSAPASKVLEILTREGAVFFNELARKATLLLTHTEQALGELVALGLATADSFDGLRALLIPSHKKPPLGNIPGARRRKAVTSVEFAGRWSLLRKPSNRAAQDESSADRLKTREQTVEAWARALLRRYGVVFRRLLERESLHVPWYELGRVYRRLEARGEIRGGYFVSGVSGEQFALAEAINLLRSTRKRAAKPELNAVSAADPLNLVGVLQPGGRITATPSNRVLLCDGVPIAGLEAGEIIRLEHQAVVSDLEIERALKVGNLAASLRPYYG